MKGGGSHGPEHHEAFRRTFEGDCSDRTARPSRLADEPSFPRSDVGVLAFAACDPVSAKAIDIDLALHARISVLVRMLPRIAWQLVEIRPPVRWYRRGRGVGDLR